MIIAKLFPTSFEQRQEASSAPVRFFFSEFVRGAAGMALVLAVLDVIVSRNSSSSQPSERLYIIIAWAVLMAGARVWSARIGR